MTVSAAKKSKSVKGVSSHPPYGDMIKKAVKDLQERGGSSRQAITKYVKSHYKVDDKAESHLRRALVSGVKSGKLVHTKGVGASGSFKLSEKVSKPKAATPRRKTAKPKRTPKKKKVAKKVVTAKPKPVAVAVTPAAAPATPVVKPKAVKRKPVKAKKAKTPKKKAMKPKKPKAKKTPKKPRAKK